MNSYDLERDISNCYLLELLKNDIKDNKVQMDNLEASLQFIKDKILEMKENK